MILGGFFSITSISFLMFCIFIVGILGYALGRIRIQGVSLGTAGVFIVALIFGAFFFKPLSQQLTLATKVMVDEDAVNVSVGYISNALKIIENIGLVLFVTAVGFDKLLNILPFKFALPQFMQLHKLIEKTPRPLASFIAAAYAYLPVAGN